MSTLVYKQYYEAFDAGDINLNDVELHVNLVSEDYDPRKGHTKADVRDYIICSLVSLNGDIITKKSMSEIIDKIKEKCIRWIPNHQEEIAADIDKVFATKPEKAERIKERIFNVDFERGDMDYWDYLVKHGIKYFVVENKRVGEKNLLCWCEDIV